MFGSVCWHSEVQHIAAYRPSGNEEVPLKLIHVSRESSDLTEYQSTVQS